MPKHWPLTHRFVVDTNRILGDCVTPALRLLADGAQRFCKGHSIGVFHVVPCWCGAIVFKKIREEKSMQYYWTLLQYSNNIVIAIEYNAGPKVVRRTPIIVTRLSSSHTIYQSTGIYKNKGEAFKLTNTLRYLRMDCIQRLRSMRWACSHCKLPTSCRPPQQTFRTNCCLRTYLNSNFRFVFSP